MKLPVPKAVSNMLDIVIADLSEHPTAKISIEIASAKTFRIL